MDAMPAVTIGLPVRNGARFVGAAIASVQAQTHQEWHLVVADNASTDGTVAIVRALAADDPRITVVEQPRNVGTNANFNRVLAEARTPYVKWLAADDLCGPRLLADCVATLEADPSAVGACGTTRLVDAAGTAVDLGRPVDFDYSGPCPVQRVTRLLLEDPYVMALFGVWRTAAVRASGGFRPYYGSDKSLVAELLLQGPVAHVASAEHISRCHQGQSLHQDLATARAEAVSTRPRRIGALVDRIQGVAAYTTLVGRSGLAPAQRWRLLRAVVGFAMDATGQRTREAARERLRAVGLTGDATDG